MQFSPLINRLIEDLRCLPGVGPKSAQRMAFHLLEHNREAAKQLAHTLLEAVEKIGHCQSCRTLTESTLCSVCSSPKRDQGKLCIVETPADVNAIEQATDYKGLYFVLMGHLSPLDGIGPKEGEATAHYISEIVKASGIRSTRIAHGVPVGGELEYVDGGTISHAFSGRRDI